MKTNLKGRDRESEGKEAHVKGRRNSTPCIKISRVAAV